MPLPVVLAGGSLVGLGARVGALGLRRGAGRIAGFVRSRGFGRAAGAGAAFGGAEIAVSQIFGGDQDTMGTTRGRTMTTVGGFPVRFVKSWQAGAATFAIDTEGRRWVFRNNLGIWKRVKVVRNIVISGKDMYRARRLIRVSRRLQTMRHQLGAYSTRRKRTR